MAEANCGINHNELPDALSKVPAHQTKKPIASFDVKARMGPKVMHYLQEYYGDTDLEEHIHELPAAAFANMTVNETAKAIACTKYMLSSKLSEHLQENPVHKMIEKIRSSMWRWGYRSATWNETVDAYNGLRSFTTGLEDFACTLDHTRNHNQRGKAEHSETFLDGVLAYLIHYKGEHVMTIAFSIINSRRLLLQQVQLKKARGNRWLFQFPTNRVEFAVERLKAAFPRYTVFVADGADIAQISLQSYRNGLQNANKDVERYTARLLADNDNEDVARYLGEAHAAVAHFSDKISHIEADLPRLQALYRDSGRYVQGKPIKRDGIKHYAIAA